MSDAKRDEVRPGSYRAGYNGAMLGKLKVTLVAATWSGWVVVGCGSSDGGSVPVGTDSGASFDAGEGGEGTTPEGGRAGSGGRPARGGSDGSGDAGKAASFGGAAGETLGGSSGAPPVRGDAGAGGEPQALPAPDLVLSVEPSGGTFVETQTIRLQVTDPRADIRFTLNGSLPDENSPKYEAPIVVDKSTRVRAIALSPEGAKTGVLAETYLRVAPNAATFTSHLPIVIVQTFETGSINPKSDELVPASLVLLEPSEGSTSLVGRATLEARIGFRVRGESSRAYSKKQYAVELREDGSDEDKDMAVLGMPAESDWVLSESLHFDRSSVRNALAYGMSNSIGRYAPRTRFAEAFLVEGNGDVSAESFIGFYTVIEKVKRGKQRVNVKKLEPTDLTLPNMSGGYMLRIDKDENHFVAAYRDVQFVYPDWEEIRVAARAPQRDYIKQYIDDLRLAMLAADFRVPATGKHYSEIVDVDSFIDHNIINAFAKNPDGCRLSTYFYKDRGGLLFAGPVWDFDRAFGTEWDWRTTNPDEWFREESDGTDYFSEGWWGLLFYDDAFKARYKARFLELLADEFSPDTLDGLIDELAAQVGDAAQRNYERWPEFVPSGGDHASEIDAMKSWLRARAEFVQRELAEW